jgi:hypothetical protein
MTIHRGRRFCGLTGLLVAACLICGGVGTGSATQPHSATIILSSHVAAPLKFGAEQLQVALQKKGFNVHITPHASGANLQFFLGDRTDPSTGANEEYLRKTPQVPESYSVSVHAPGSVLIEGSDAPGAMYGALDVAEQIQATTEADLARQIKPSINSPFLKIRGINMFVTTQDIESPQGAFWSEEYWGDYFDMMARDRYNFLDIQGPCDAVTLRFPDAFSLFVSLPDFPQVGVGPPQAAKNMAQLRHVIEMAARRGVKVGFMNYEAAPPIGPWPLLRYGTDERWTPLGLKYLTGPAVVTYTREAVASFLRQLPGLWMFGFRIGESFQPADFYKQTYLDVLNHVRPQLKIYLRTWLANPNDVRALGAATRHQLYIEPKYNGEQLGLPYQAVLGGRRYPPSGSYENYTNYPRDYSIIWQIRAHGTHRVFYWMWPDFARRTVRSCKFGDGVGFSMEPMDAYCPAQDYLHNNPAIDHHFYKWMFQRYWVWNLVWGRTAYDPNIPDAVFIHKFVERFGPAAGPVIFRALTESSKIVPFIYAYHNVGLDHQEFAPEFENGDHSLDARSRIWQGTRLVPYGGDDTNFLQVGTLDRTAMATPVDYVRERLKGIVDGRMGPFEAASYLQNAAETSLAAIQQAASLHPSSPRNFDCIKMDIEAVNCLGRYYANRIRSVTHLEFYDRTYDHPELNAAYDSLERAISDWDHLSEVTARHFGYVPEYIRMGVARFRWKDEGRSLGVDLDQVNNLEARYRALPAALGYRPVIGYVPPAKVKPGQALKLTATFATAYKSSDVSLFYRNSQSDAYTSVTMTPANTFERTWTSAIPAFRVVPGFLDYYFEAMGRGYGGSLMNGNPYRVLVNSNDAKPVISSLQLAGPEHGAFVNLEADVRDSCKVRAVYVFYKRMPSYYDWVRLKMQSASGDHYQSKVPLTPQGILYYFEAIDEDGNAAHYPDFLKQTPYLAITGWAVQGHTGKLAPETNSLQ